MEARGVGDAALINKSELTWPIGPKTLLAVTDCSNGVTYKLLIGVVWVPFVCVNTLPPTPSEPYLANVRRAESISFSAGSKYPNDLMAIYGIRG